jgi:hypothetical protein
VSVYETLICRWCGEDFDAPGGSDAWDVRLCGQCIWESEAEWFFDSEADE